MSEYAELLKFLTDPEATGLHNDAADAIAKLEAERDALREALGRLVYDIDALAESSSGVTGLHQNGDTAPWSELLEGGASEPWLGEAMTQARDALDLTHTPAGN